MGIYIFWQVRPPPPGGEDWADVFREKKIGKGKFSKKKKNGS
jgi:hypothetical protein